jgi:excisionase family DNA binding protein/PAS domain S-box-containing protein
MLTTGELARLLGVTAPTVIHWMESGQLPFERLGPRGRRLIREQEVRDYVARQGLDPARLEPSLWGRVLVATTAPEAAPAFFFTDRNFRCVHWNSQAQVLLGWTSADVLGTGLEKIGARVPGMEVDLRGLSEAPPGQEGPLSLHVEMRHRAGDWIPVELTLNWIRGCDREIEGVGFICRKMA